MSTSKNNNRIYVVAGFFLLVAFAVIIKLMMIQWVEGPELRKLAKERTVKNIVIPANKGNVYAADGSLLATSIPNYTLRFDALAPQKSDFDENIKALSDSLSKTLGKPAWHYLHELKKARENKNRYLLIARKLSFTTFQKIKSYPLFNLGTYKGGLIVEQKIVRQHPVGKIAARTIGYDRVYDNGMTDGKGIEWAFRGYLRGKDGRRLVQKIAKNQWKPISDNNEVEPQDGYDIVTTLDVYIQDIAHHALLKQLEYYKADHGCVVVMETKTGAIKAISNLGRDTDSGNYFETSNYAIQEAHEPGSTFKLVDMLALLEDEKADTSTVYSSYGGDYVIHNRHVEDSQKGGYGSISLGRAFEVSSNTVLVQAVYKNYKNNPADFVAKINALQLNKPLGLPFKGEGKPKIPQVTDANWSGISMPWMAFGYGLAVTPLQTLTLYNAVANNGEMVRPLFIKEIKEWNKIIKKFDKEVMVPKIASDETLSKVKAVLANVVKKGTGKKLYSPNFSMAGKTGTAQVNYHKGDSKMYYASSFVGFFPVENPKYSCVVIIHKPNVAAGYYGADVAGPVFKRIAQKIYTDAPETNKLKKINVRFLREERAYNTYFKKLEKSTKKIPNVVGMPAMDAVALLENIGLKVKIKGFGKVKKQSEKAGNTIRKSQTITLELS